MIDGAESEFLVQSSHSCQEKPRTLIEIRRILREHIGVDSADLTGVLEEEPAEESDD